MEELRVLSPAGMLGYGFPEKSFWEGIRKEPDVIGIDAGSTDAGPHKLGAGASITSTAATKKDLSHILKAGYEKKIPILIGSAGGSGAQVKVDWTVDIAKEICREKNYHFKIAIIGSEINKNYLKKKLKEGKISPLGPVPELTENEIEEAIRIVGVMGVHPYIKSLNEGADLIIAGRSNDPAIFAALPIKNGYDPGLALHLGKILECGALSATPATTADCMMGYLRKDNFVVEPPNPKRICTPLSVAAHTLYEKSSPLHIAGPSGVVDVTSCKFEKYTERATKVSGTRLLKSSKFNIKLEGSKRIAYRTICIAGARDPIMIERVDEWINYTKQATKEYFKEILPSDYKILFHIYGRDGVMGELEPVSTINSHEIGIILEVVAKSQELSDTICSYARATLLHYPYKGRKATAGNLAFPYAPSDLSMGEVFKFNIHHLVEVDDPLELFPIKYFEI